MKIKLKLTAPQTKAIALSSLDADVESINDGFTDKYRKVATTEARLLIKRLLLLMVNSSANRKKALSLSPFEALTLELVLRDVLEEKAISHTRNILLDDYTKNILLSTANELDQKLINLTS